MSQTKCGIAKSLKFDRRGRSASMKERTAVIVALK